MNFVVFGFAVAVCVVAGFFASSALSLPLDKEIARLPAASRPTTAQSQRALAEQKEWERLSDEAWQRIGPEMKDWAARGKPYITWVTHPDDLPTEWADNPRHDPIERRVADYIAGMTDRYAIQVFERFYVPGPWAVLS